MQLTGTCSDAVLLDIICPALENKQWHDFYRRSVLDLYYERRILPQDLRYTLWSRSRSRTWSRFSYFLHITELWAALKGYCQSAQRHQTGFTCYTRDSVPTKFHEYQCVNLLKMHNDRRGGRDISIINPFIEFDLSHAPNIRIYMNFLFVNGYLVFDPLCYTCVWLWHHDRAMVARSFCVKVTH